MPGIPEALLMKEERRLTCEGGLWELPKESLSVKALRDMIGRGSESDRRYVLGR